MDPLLDRAPCGFVAFADDGTLRTVNTTLAELLGYTRVELEGWHIEKILFPGARIFYQTHLFPMLKLHGRVDEIYLALRTKDGRDLPVLMNGVRRERGGEAINDCVFMRMIQRDQYEEQLLTARRMAEQANSAKASFLSMISHDLRTPLTSITGHASLIAQGILGSEQERRYSAERIQHAASGLMRMINDILNFAQVEAGRLDMRPVPVPVRDAIERAESLVRLRMRDVGLTFVPETCDDESVLADPDRLQQILLNLLTNAIKFTPSGGTISIGCTCEGARLRILVRDTGIGIDSAQLQRIFEPFVQLDPEGAERGVGLGLAISRELVRAMDGELTAESTPGQGSVFIVDLPRA